MTEKLIQSPRTEHFFTRLPQQGNPGGQELEFLLVAPVYQLQSALDNAQQPLPSAMLTWEAMGGEGDTTRYRDIAPSANPVVATLPGLRRGAAVDPASVEMFLQIGTGPGSLTALQSLERARILLAQTLSYNIIDVGASGWRVRLHGVDLKSRLRGIPLPGQPAGAGVGAPSSNPGPNTTLETVNVEIAIGPHRGVVAAVDPDDMTLAYVLFATRAAPPLNPVDLETGLVTLRSRAASFRVIPEGQPHFVPVGGVAPALIPIESSADGIVLYNFDEREWTVNWTSSGAGPVSASVNLMTSPPVLNIAVPEDSGNPDDVDPAGATVAALNAALRAAFLPAYGGWMPLYFGGDGGIDEEFANLPGTADAMVVAWRGRIETTAREASPPPTRININVPEGVPSSPLSVERIGTDVFINLATDGGGNYAAGANPVSAVKALLEEADSSLVLAIEDGSPTGPFTPFSLGYLQAMVVDEEAQYYVWGASPEPVPGEPPTFRTSSPLRYGCAPGGVFVAGGRLLNIIPPGSNLSARLYAGYRALRVDLSAGASRARTGNRPTLTMVTRDSVEQLLGEISPRNPGALAAWVFLTSAGANRRVHVLSPSEVSSLDPWGTQEAIREANDFAMKRNVYYVGLLNDGYWVPGVTQELAEALGGTDTVPLRKPMRYMIPTTNRETSPDELIASGLDAERHLAPNTNQLTGSLNFVLAEVETGDVIVFDGFEDVEGATVTLQTRERGFRVTALSVNASPFSVEVDGTLPVGVNGNTSFRVYRAGQSLLDNLGRFQSEVASRALAEWHRASAHPRIAKHHVDVARVSVRGQLLDLPSPYALAEFMGVMSGRSQIAPMSTVTYPLSRRVEGTHSLYNDEQLQRLAGAGLILPYQATATDEDGRVQVYRDVSADTSTRVFQRRTAGVAEDIWVIALDSIIKPLLGPNTLTEEMKVVVSGRITALVRTLQAQRYFKVLSFEDLVEINDEIRAQYGINDTGLLATYRIQHYEEFGVMLNAHIIEP